MDSKGRLSVQPARQSRLVAILAGIWLVIILVLGFWWGTLLLRQSARIAELSVAAGVPQAEAFAELARTQRMLQWESGSFLILLLTLSAALFWFYWRDMQRARGTQAFFAALTHELRTPLTSVRLQSEAIAAGAPTQELVERLLSDTYRLESQIDKTLELARIEGGGALAEQAIRLDPWLERVLRGIAASEGDAMDIAVTLEPALPAIRGDTAALQLILRNLLENSLRHGDRDPVQVSVTASKVNGNVELSFRDNGRGFEGDPSRLGRLFQRGSASRGTGVGLYLVRVLMERMGGKVEFSNAADGGFATKLRFQRSPG